MKFDSVISMVGNTPLVRISSGSKSALRLWVKLEGANPSGSIKDRACIANIRDAEATGRLKPGMTLLDASSGNMACALAYFGRILNYSVSVVCSSKLTEDKARFIRYFGAELECIGNFTYEGNRHCADVIYPRAPDEYCFLDQLHNWANPEAAFQTLGPEILRDLPDVTAVVGSLGSGGSLTGTARFLKQHNPDIAIVAVQAKPGSRIPGTGSFDEGDYVTPFIKKAYDDGLFAHTEKVSVDEAVGQTKRLTQEGLFVGFQTGGVVHAAFSAIQRLNLQGDVVAISGDTAWKNMDKLLGD